MPNSLVGFLWITPSDADYAEQRISSDYHLGCAYLSAYLLQRGLLSRHYILRSATAHDFAAMVAADGIRVLGLSLKDTNYYAARWIAEAVKQVAPTVLVVAGGLTATFLDALVLEKCPQIDACIRGFAEVSFYELIRAFLSGEDWRKSPSLSFRIAGSISRNPDNVVPPTENLDCYPSPYLSGILPGELGPSVGISTSRGCIFRCTFCNPTAMAGFQIAYHSDDRVIDELQHIDSALGQKGDDSKHLMLLNEDIFALNPARTKRLCDRIARSGLRRLIFGCETRIEHLTEDVLRSMYSAGFRFLKFGLESGNPRVLNLIKKVRTSNGAKDGYAAEKEFLAKLKRSVAAAKSIGFRIATGAIFGLPGERLPDAIDTLHFLRQLDIDEYYHNFLQIFAGTEIYRTYAQWGYRLELRDGFYPTIYRTYWPYPVELVPRLEDKLKHSLHRGVVHL